VVVADIAEVGNQETARLIEDWSGLPPGRYAGLWPSTAPCSPTTDDVFASPSFFERIQSPVVGKEQIY
jgi:hypothetical protein